MVNTFSFIRVYSWLKIILDTITHGLIGALASKTGFYQKAGRVATVAFSVGAVFPDIDVAASLLGPEFGLRYHRGITHSLIAAPFFALLIGAIIRRFSSFKNLGVLSLIAALGIYSHIFFDLITSYGTVIFDPLSMKRYGWDLVFILDPFISIPVIAGIIICWKNKKAAFKVSAIIFLFLSLYLLFCLYCREASSEKLADFIENESLSFIKSSVYPRPLAPFFWMGAVETEDAFYRVDMSLFDSGIKDFRMIPKPDENPFIKSAKELRTVRLYLWFAKFPVLSYRVENDNHLVEFYDLRFGVIPNSAPFLLRVTFDGSGSLRNIYLNGRLVEEKLP